MRKAPENKEFLEAYDAYSDAIFRYCMIKTRDRELALDITQDAFMKTWEYMGDGKIIDNIRAFLYRVARNLIIDHSRKKKSMSLDALMEEGIDFEGKELHNAEHAFDAEQAIKKIETLDEKYRDPLLLRYVEGLSVKEIAGTLNEKENTVSVRIHRGLDQVNKLFNSKQFDE